MSDYQRLMVQSLREEIASFNAHIETVVVLVTVVSVAAFVLAHHPTFRRAALLIPFAIASGLFAIGRADLLMHRAGAFILQIESGLNEPIAWEAFKRSRTATSMLPLYDAGALALWAFLLIWAEREVWRQPAIRRRSYFLAGTVLLVLAAVASIVYGAR